MVNADTQLLLHLLRSADACPPTALVKNATPELLQMAIRNKVVFGLNHFLSCTHCRQHLNTSLFKRLKHYERFSLTSSLLYEQERRRITHFLKRQKGKGIFYKDSPTKQNRPLFATLDIDVLVSAQNAKKLARWLAKQRYTKTAYPPKEVTFKKRNHLDIDVHTRIAHPHYGSLTHEEFLTVTAFTADYLAQKQKEHLQFHLLSLVVRFFFNDLTTGIGTLYEIGLAAQALHSRAQWSKLWALAQKYQLGNKTLWTIALAKKLDGRSTKDIRRNIPKRVRLLAWLLPISWYMHFPTLAQWHEKKYAAWAETHQARLRMLQFILRDDVSFFRLLRPRVLRFAFEAARERLAS